MMQKQNRNLGTPMKQKFIIFDHITISFSILFSLPSLKRIFVPKDFFYHKNSLSKKLYLHPPSLFQKGKGSFYTQKLGLRNLEVKGQNRDSSTQISIQKSHLLDGRQAGYPKLSQNLDKIQKIDMMRISVINLPSQESNVSHIRTSKYEQGRTRFRLFFYGKLVRKRKKVKGKRVM